MAKRLSMLRIHQDIHAKTYNDRYSKPQQKHRLGTVSKNITQRGSLNRFYVATTLAFISAVVCTRHLFSPREGFLTHQCNIFENIKIKWIQRWNNDEDSTARNNWMLKQKKTNSRTPVGPTRARGPGTIRLTLKSSGRSHHRVPACIQRRKQNY